MLYTNCIPVRGASRSVIVDTQRKGMYFIDNELYEILNISRQQPWQAIVEQYDESSLPIIQEYLAFIEENELCFWTDNPALFPELNLEFDVPALITNAIIDVNSTSTHDWKDIFSQLSSIGCRDVQIRFFDQTSTGTIEYILELLRESYIKSVELIFKFDHCFSKRYLNDLIDKNVRIKNLVLHSSPKNEVYRYGAGSGMGNIAYLTQIIDSNVHCGIVNPDYFTIEDPRTFAEFKNFNSCLNKKISIDESGNIKNCPSLKKIYGNISSSKLEDAVTAEFKEIWQVNKDQIETCKICEFRYVCSDCRAFVENPGNTLSKPAKCSYDPHKMSWT